jgi:hypothetical protein
MVVGATDRCDVCDQGVEDASPFDIFNESGATIVRVCPECEEKLGADQCAVCGDRVPEDREEAIAPHGSPEPGEALCPDCRRDIIFGEGGVFQ